MASRNSDLDAIIAQGDHRPRRIWISAGLVLAAMLAAIVWYMMTATASDTETYVTQPARIADIVVTVTATGTVEPTNMVEISSELSGTIRSVEVDDNDPVKVGQPLARLDTLKLEAAVEHAKATLASRSARVAEAEATLAEMREAYERAVQLDERGVSSRQSFVAARAGYDRAVAALASARADVRVAKADLQLDEADLKKACICSSIDGIVLERSVEVGQIVASSLQAPVLFKLADDLRKMELLVDIDEADIGKVRVGNTAKFTVEAYQNRVFPAVIAQLRYAPETVEGVVTYKAELAIDNADLLLRPGMTATAEIEVEAIAGTLVIPNAALRYRPPVEQAARQGGSGLLGLIIPRPPSTAGEPTSTATGSDQRVVHRLRDGKAETVEIRIGASDGIVTQVLGGALETGDAVIVDRVAR